MRSLPRVFALLLRSTDRTLYGYGKSPLPVVGCFSALLAIGSSKHTVEFVVIEGRGEILLGRDSALLFGALVLPEAEFAHAVTADDYKANLERKFPSVFEGIGLLKDYHAEIHIDESVQPVAQKPRPVPFPLREKVSAKIRELLDADIIEAFQGPTPWVSPIVVAPKPNGGHPTLH